MLLPIHRGRRKKNVRSPVELDKRLGGVIASLRVRGEFGGDASETLLITPPAGRVKAKSLLLVGLAEDDEISLKMMERIGRTSLREASRLGIKKVGFAPLLRDQGNAKLPSGDVEVAVVKGMLLAYDTELRLQREGLAKPFTLEEWKVEAGPAFYDYTVTGVRKAVQVASASRLGQDLRFRTQATQNKDRLTRLWKNQRLCRPIGSVTVAD